MSWFLQLGYRQQQLFVTGLVLAAWLTIELLPKRWHGRYRKTVVRGARFIGATTVVTMLMIYLRVSITEHPKPRMWAVFIGTTLAAAVFLTRRETIRRFVPKAGPDELGVLRCVIGATLLFLVARDDLVSTLLLPESLIRREGYVWWLYRRLHGARWLLDVRSLTWLRVVYWTALLSSFTTMIGLASRVSAVICALSFTLFYHTLCTYSHFFHSGLVPLLVLYVLLWFPTGASFSVDAILRRRRGRGPLEAPPELWSRGVYAVWLMYGLSYWAAGGSKLAQSQLWNGESLRMYAVRDSDYLLEFDFDLSQHLVAWNVDELVFYPAAFLVLVVEVCALWVMFSGRARLWFPPILVLFHVGVLFLQGIAFFDLMLLPLAFIPATHYRKLGRKLGLARLIGEDIPAPELEAVVERRNRSLGRVLIVAMLPALLITGWLFKVERFPLLTRWGMFQTPVRGEVSQVVRLYAVHADGRRERTDLTNEIPALNNTRWRDTVIWPVTRSIRSRLTNYKRIQDLLNATAAIHNAGKPESEHIVHYELVFSAWKLEEDRNNPEWGTPAQTIIFVVGDEEHPQEPVLRKALEK